MEDKKEEMKVVVPSFQVERYTQGLNSCLWGFIGLISMFSVGVGVVVSHMMFVSIFNVISTFMSDNSVVVLPALVVAFAIVFGVGLYHFFNNMTFAYRFDNDKIVRGQLIRPEKIKGSSLALEGLLTAYMAANIGDSGKFTSANSLKGVHRMIELIVQNMDQNFANMFFDTDLYKKKAFLNPRLIKETKRSYIYQCDNKKRLKILKIYTGMATPKEGVKEKAIWKRVLSRSIFVFLVFAIIFAADLAIGLSQNADHMEHIQQAVSRLEDGLTDFGYIKEESTEKICEFQKKASSERTSSVKYDLDKNGEIDSVTFEVYFNRDSKNMPSEVAYLISSTNGGYSESDIAAFIDNVQKTIDGNFTYDKLESSNGKIVLSLSGGHAHIYKYS